MKVKELRAKLGISQTEFADKVGAEYHSVIRWEREGKISKLAKIQIERVFKVKVD